jgi:hypothetical protein
MSVIIREPLFYVFLVQGLSFLLMFFVLFKAIKKATARTYVYVFYMLAAFAINKCFSAWANGLALFTGTAIDLYGLTLINLSTIFTVISNVFLFQFAIELLTHKLRTRNIFRIFPILFFSGYIVLLALGLIETFDANSIGRLSFGYNGAILSSIALFNLYYTMRQSSGVRLLRGILASGLGFAFYSIFDGLAEKPISGVPICVFGMFSAIILTAASFYLVELFDEKKIRMVDYI